MTAVHVTVFPELAAAADVEGCSPSTFVARAVTDRLAKHDNRREWAEADFARAARELLQAALDQDIPGQLLNCLFHGGGATIDRDSGRVVLVDPSITSLTIENVTAADA